MESDFLYDESLESSPLSLLQLSLRAVGRWMSKGGWLPPLENPLPSELSNSLMATLHANKWLNEETISLFDRRFRLTEVDFSYCKVSFDSLLVLRLHRIQRLSLREASIVDSVLDLRTVLLSLGPRALSSLEHLNISGVKPIEGLSSLKEMKYLTTLIVSESPIFGDEELRTVCTEMMFIKVLDISQTSITSVAPLYYLRHSLEVLVMHRLRLSHSVAINGVADTLRLLEKLTLLDVSDKRVDVQPNSIGEPLQVDIGTLVVREIVMSGVPWWPKLRSLDIAGSSLHFHSRTYAAEYITIFISLHPHLEYISILDTCLNRVPYQYLYDRDKPLQIANGGTRAQCLLALQRYWRPDREAFASHALQAVYYLLQTSYDEFQPMDLRLTVRGVVLSMLNHKRNASIQMAGSACLYHLCKSRRVYQLTARETRHCVDRCLDAAEYHPLLIQLQKNVWLTVCSDHLLQSQNFDMFRTCRVALEAMVNTQDASVSRMTIAIVSILAPKLPTTQSHRLATNKRYVSHLIEMISGSMENPDMANDNFNNFTIKFTLSALWNLTDESPTTCRLFVQLGGINATFGVLKFYADNTNIQTKVLGLLNNIAEVKNLKRRLLHHRYIQTVLDLLDSDLKFDDPALMVAGDARRIDVSYFAAGILANLLDCSPWTFEPSSETCNEALVTAVKRWPKPHLTMVAYRSFTPFFVLLRQDELSGAQMWAAWAIQHVCTSDKQNNYIKMLVAQGGHEEFQRLANSNNAHPDVVQLAHSVLCLIKDSGCQV